MSETILIEPLTAEAFAPFGDVIDNSTAPDQMINGGRCARHHDLARLDFDGIGRAGISVFHGQPYSLPHTLDLVERHPLGSQTFLPMSDSPYLAIVARDEGGKPVAPRAFLAKATQGINILRNVWHGVLTPLEREALFGVVDWISESVNVEEYHFEQPLIVTEG